jgi:hypothetical protein
MQRILSTEVAAHVGGTVRLAGWIHRAGGSSRWRS